MDICNVEMSKHISRMSGGKFTLREMIKNETKFTKHNLYLS